MAHRLPKSILNQEFSEEFVFIPKDKIIPPPQHVVQSYEWIDKLLNSAAIEMKGKELPSLNELVEAMQRYDIIFGELIKQTGTYSEKIAQSEQKAWMGVMRLLECLIKSFHRHAKQTQYIQSEAKSILLQKHNQELQEKRNQEEYTLEKASLRAQNRNLEAQVDALSMENRVIRRERDGLRDVIRDYIYEGIDPLKKTNTDNKKDANVAAVLTKPKDTIVVNTNTMQQSNLKLIRQLDVELNKALDESLGESNKFMNLVYKLGEELKKHPSIDLNSMDEKKKAKQALNYEFSNVVRYEDVGIQCDEKDIYDAIDTAENENILQLNSNKRETFPYIPWEDFAHVPLQPCLLEHFMRNKYSVMRIPSLEWLHQTIFSIYEDRILHDRILATNSNGAAAIVPSLADYVYNVYFQKRFNLQSAMDVQCAVLLRATEAYLESSSRVRLFSRCLNFSSNRIQPNFLDNADCQFLLQVFEGIFESGLMTEDSKLGFMIPVAFIFELIHRLLGIWSQDCSLECSKGVRGLDTLGPRDAYVLVDDVLPVFVESWSGVRELFETHIHYLAKKCCSVYRVVSELAYSQDVEDYAGEDSGRARDVVLNRVSDKTTVAQTTRRPMRTFDEQKNRFWTGKEVVDLLSKKEFFYACASMLPAISEEEVENMFQKACETITAKTLRLCVEEGGWRELLLDDGRKVYANVISRKLQFKKPYEASTYRDSGNVDIETFTAMVLQQNLLTRGPYSSFVVTMRPEDFWPHAETYLRQKRAAAEIV